MRTLVQGRYTRLLVFAATLCAIAAHAAPPAVSPVQKADAVRLLEQSTFGPTQTLVDHVMAIGVQGFLDEQFVAPASRYPALKYVPSGQQATFCAADPDPHCARDYYTAFLVQNAFFRNALNDNDQLRQRVAFALSQIFVISGVQIHEAYGLAGYQQMLLDNAFGNFLDLLTSVTLSSAMGDYLDMANNDKTHGPVNPNENYAREVMQLFSIGVWELRPDGTRLLDAAGQPIPTYTQDTIESFASVFTGWTYPVLPGGTPKKHNPKNYLGPMIAFEADHDTGSKTLLEGAVSPAGLSTLADLTVAMHNIFMHPNVGPFIGRQLIQKLVTGNPSAQYVSRVAAVFNDDGHGVRGDMKAVINAILVDHEARGPVKPDAGYGKLREPVLFMTGLARALDTQSDGVFFGAQSKALGQNLFNAASVFNYYPPDYAVPGTDLYGPEFALQNASTTINRYNFGNALAFAPIAPIATLPGATGTQPNWAALQKVAGDTDTLLDTLDALLLHGTMPAAMKRSIAQAVDAIPASDAATRARTAFYLVATSPQYQVER